MARALLLLIIIVFAFACTNLDDATPSSRQSLVRFYGNTRDYVAMGAEIDSEGGLIIVGNMPATGDQPDGVILLKIKSDGTKDWEQTFPGGSANSIKILSDGYLITGDGIELNPSSNQITELVNTKIRLIKTDLNGVKLNEFTKDSTVTVNQGLENVVLTVDFHGSASNVEADGTLVTLGSFKTPSGTERIITAGFNNSTLQPKWSKTLQLDNYNYSNTHTLNLTSSKLIWASTRLPLDASLSAHLGVATVLPNYASPSNYSLFGEKNEERKHVAGDMQPSSTGFGVIGTYSDKDASNSNANIYFIKVDVAGNIVPGSEIYFDGADSQGAFQTYSNGLKNIANKNNSGSEDSGDAITFTRDGGFILAGSMLTTPVSGNGGKDILLIKIDAFGNLLWQKRMGGSGDETAIAVREQADGNLIICGTSKVNEASNIFIMRTDKNGELKN